MSLWLREKRDGTRGPGYLAYLAGAALAVAAILALRRRVVQAVPASLRLPPSDVAPITQSAAAMTRVRVRNGPAPPEARSFRLPAAAPAAAAPAPSGSDAFDAMAAALQAAPAEGESGSAAPLDETAATRAPPPAYPELPPAFVPEARGDAGGQLLGYRDAGADRAPDPAPEPPSGPAPLPRGTLIPVYLLTSVDTSNPAAVLQLAIAREVDFGGRCALPFGTRLLGRLSGPPRRNRLNLAVDTVLYPDGRERPMLASAVEADETGADLRPGVAAWYLPPPTWVQIAPYVSEAATGYLGLLESRLRQPVTLGLGGVSVQTSAPEDGARAPLYQASAQAVQDFAAARLKEVSERYASYYFIPAGTACWLQLESDFHE
ncbi:MAG TPA: hypothetical protein VHV47_05985 [Opitutaceae bacterium]|nr:hypothetical protein [Opitutaceae bacterium]